MATAPNRLMYVDEIDYMGIYYWYEAVKEHNKQLKESVDKAKNNKK